VEEASSPSKPFFKSIILSKLNLFMSVRHVFLDWEKCLFIMCGMYFRGEVIS